MRPQRPHTIPHEAVITLVMIATIIRPQILSETRDQPFISAAGFHTSTSSGIMSICDQWCRTLHLPGSLSQLRGRGYWTDATGAAYAFSGNYKIVH